MRTKHIAALFLLLLIGQAHAGSLDIFGFKLGEKLVLPECELTKLSDPPDTCIRNVTGYYGRPAGREITFARKETPLIVSSEYGSASPLESGDRLIGMEFITAGVKSQELVLHQLTTKYGSPTSVTKRRGTVFATWRLSRIHVTFDGASDGINRGLVTIDLPEATKLRAKILSEERSTERKL
ncbi:MAG: hypothetical protein NT159_01405 [Proteobacteria bacterium]|nr:hypothetical protein [Pseudomonadota bacterium]